MQAISSDFVRAEEDCILRAIFDYCAAQQEQQPIEDDDDDEEEEEHAIDGSDGSHQQQQQQQQQPAPVLGELLSHCRFPFVTETMMGSLTPEERGQIPTNLLAERAAFQPSTAFTGLEAEGAPSEAAVPPPTPSSVKFTDSDGDVVEFQRCETVVVCCLFQSSFVSKFLAAWKPFELECQENGLFEPFTYQNDHSTKTGSGQT